MGGGCSSQSRVNPFPENICGDGDFIGMTKDVLDACFFSTEVGKYCDGTQQSCFGSSQGATEWVPAGAGANCGVCSGCKGKEQGSGNGACGFGRTCSWAGKRQKCARVAFNGDPLKCCRRSKFIQGSSLFCFDDDSKIRTCDPQFRGFAQPSCVPVMAGYCSNDSEEPYRDKWVGNATTKDCRRFVQENAGKLDFYGPVIGAMITRYLITDNNPITSFETNGSNHDPFIETIIEVCRENPGACDDILTQKCQGVTREQLSNNVNLANLCGCFMADIEYEAYSQFGIERECDPVCALGSSVKLHNTSTNNPAEFIECNQSICVIDDVTINILANSVAGDVTFSQACGSCAGNDGSSCRCYINDTSINAINSLIGDVTFEQACGGTPLCYKSASVVGAPPISIDCETGEEIERQVVGNTIDPTNKRNILWAIAAGLIGVVLLIILVITSGSKPPAQPILIPGRKGRPTRPMISKE